MQPWNDWYHCTLHTYGTWLRGDPRGWRARHHREHVDGDYKNPPPMGKYDALLQYSKSLMKREPIRIDENRLCNFVLGAFIERLQEYAAPVAIGSFDGVHVHLLVQCRDQKPRIVLGIAKQYATAQLKAHGLAVGLDLKNGEGLWGKRSHPEPIVDERYYHRAFGYISDHRKRGAVVVIPTEVRGAVVNDDVGAGVPRHI